jgi:hypothetical protein
MFIETFLSYVSETMGHPVNVALPGTQRRHPNLWAGSDSLVLMQHSRQLIVADQGLWQGTMRRMHILRLNVSPGLHGRKHGRRHVRCVSVTYAVT